MPMDMPIFVLVLCFLSQVHGNYDQGPAHNTQRVSVLPAHQSQTVHRAVAGTVNLPTKVYQSTVASGPSVPSTLPVRYFRHPDVHISRGVVQSRPTFLRGQHHVVRAQPVFHPTRVLLRIHSPHFSHFSSGLSPFITQYLSSLPIQMRQHLMSRLIYLAPQQQIMFMRRFVQLAPRQQIIFLRFSGPHLRYLVSHPGFIDMEPEMAFQVISSQFGSVNNEVFPDSMSPGGLIAGSVGDTDPRYNLVTPGMNSAGPFFPFPDIGPGGLIAGSASDTDPRYNLVTPGMNSAGPFPGVSRIPAPEPTVGVPGAPDSVNLGQLAALRAQFREGVAAVGGPGQFSQTIQRITTSGQPFPGIQRVPGLESTSGISGAPGALGLSQLAAFQAQFGDRAVDFADPVSYSQNILPGITAGQPFLGGSEFLGLGVGEASNAVDLGQLAALQAQFGQGAAAVAGPDQFSQIVVRRTTSTGPVSVFSGSFLPGSLVDAGGASSGAVDLRQLAALRAGIDQSAFEGSGAPNFLGSTFDPRLGQTSGPGLPGPVPDALQEPNTFAPGSLDPRSAVAPNADVTY